MKGAVRDSLQVLFGVVAFVENQSDVKSVAGQRTAALEKFFGDATEGHRIVLIPRIGMMKQGNLAIGSNQQGQAQNPQVVSTLLAMASLRSLGSGVEAIQEGEEVRGVKQQAMQVQTETRNHRAGDVLFDGGDVLVADARHVVPKALTGELPGRQRQQAPQRRFLVPIGNVGLAAGGDAAVEGGQQHVLTDRGSLIVTLGKVSAKERYPQLLLRARACGNVKNLSLLTGYTVGGRRPAVMNRVP